MAKSVVKAPDGKTYTIQHPEGASEKQIFSFLQSQMREGAIQPDSKVDTPSQEMPSEMSFGQAAKLGLMDFAEQFIPDVFIYGKNVDLSSAPTVEEQYGIKERFKREVAGVPMGAEQNTEETLVRALSDPLSLVGSRNLTSLPGIVANIANQTSNVAATTAGVLSSEAVQEADLSPLSKEILGVVVGGLTASLAGTTTAAGVSTGGKAITDALSTVRSLNPVDMLAESGVNAKLASIKATEGDSIQQKISAIQELQEVVPELRLPLAALAADNPIVSSWLKEVSASDPEFRVRFNKEMAEVNGNLLKAYDELIGSSEPINVSALRSMLKERQQNTLSQAKKELDSQLSGLERKEGELAAKLLSAEDDVSIGQQIDNTLKARESAVRSQAGKLYDKAIKGATDRNTMVTPEEVASVYRTARQLKIDDLFASQPSIATKIKTNWSPKKVEASPIVGLGGAPLRGQTLEFKPAAIKDLDSLKRAINKEKRNTKSDDFTKLAKLNTFKDQVDVVINSIATRDPDFSSDYRAADNFFWKELGVPTSAEGMKSISRAKFETTTARQLQDFEKARDYIGFVGEAQGLPVVRHALRLAAKKAGVVDDAGTIDQNKLSKFVSSRSRLIELARMQPEFADVQGGLKTIRDSARQHEEVYKQVSKEMTDGFFTAITGKELPSVVREFVSNPAKREMYIRQIKNLPPGERDLAMTGLQQGILDEAVNSPGTMLDYITKHKDAMSELFGKDHVRNIEKLAAVTDIMKSMESNISSSMGRVQSVDTLQQATGISFAELSGTLRNQILSSQRQAINLTMKSVTAKGAEKREKRAGDILLSKDVMEALANPPKGWGYYAAAAKEGSVTKAKELGSHFVKVLNEILPLQSARGVEAAKTPSEDTYPPLLSAAN